MSVIFIWRVILDMLQSGGNKTVNKLENICDIISLKVAKSKSIILNGTINLYIFTNVTMNAEMRLLSLSCLGMQFVITSSQV